MSTRLPADNGWNLPKPDQGRPREPFPSAGTERAPAHPMNDTPVSNDQLGIQMPTRPTYIPTPITRK